MKLTVVGCSGSYPGPDSPASCYLLEADLDGRTWRIVLDLGSGALGALHRYVDPLTVDAVLLSHLHADHCLDLTGYYVMRKYHPSGPSRGSRVGSRRDRRPDGAGLRPAAAAGHERAVRLPHLGRTGADRPVRRGADPGRPPRPGVRAAGVRGRRDRRLQRGHRPLPALDRVADEVDLLLAEASFRAMDDNPEGLHLTGADCGALASRAGVKSLVITHVPPWHDPWWRCTRRRSGTPVRWSWPARARSTTSDPSLPVAPPADLSSGRPMTRHFRFTPGRRRARRSRSAPGSWPRACRTTGTRAPSRSGPTGAARPRSRRC